MKVVLSVDPIKFPLTGIGRYTFELAQGLQRAGLQDLQFLRGVGLTRQIPVPNQAQPMSTLPAWKQLAQKNRWVVAAFRTINPWLKARVLRGLEDNVFHGPNYYLPPFGGRSVVTMHDLSPYLWSQSHPPERVRYMQAEIELSLKRASALITDTEYTRQEVARFFSWPLDRIYVVPLASAAEFSPRPPEEVAPVIAEFGLAPGAYTLFTGTVEPRKNLDVLLDAYLKLPVTLRKAWPLVIAGYRGWGGNALHDRLRQAQDQGWLRYLGFVPQHTLPFLMAGARLFAYPSLYEGFGLPVLEAMACGVPVVCSNASTLPEVAGSAAAFHDPDNVDALVDLLAKGLTDEGWRTKASAAGLAQAAGFSWQRCTQETMNVYKAIAQG